VWTNCALYNRKEDYVGKVGARADGCFERLWAATGYEAGARIRRRATAGIAAPKYEPAAEPLEKKAPPRNATSGKSLRNGAQARLYGCLHSPHLRVSRGLVLRDRPWRLGQAGCG